MCGVASEVGVRPSYIHVSCCIVICEKRYHMNNLIGVYQLFFAVLRMYDPKAQTLKATDKIENFVSFVYDRILKLEMKP